MAFVPRSTIPMVVLALGVNLSGGCVSWKDNHDPYSGQWRLLDAKQQILDEKFDRARLESFAGRPTIDDGEEWVYVSKFEEGEGIPLDMIMAIYASGIRPVWKTTVVTFDELGLVSGIRTATARSEISERQSWWTLMGVNMKKNVRLRKVPVTQPESTQP